MRASRSSGTGKPGESRPTVRVVSDPLKAVIGQPVPIILPEPEAAFARRAARLRQLAADHPLAEWLSFLAAVCAAQSEAVVATPSPDLLPAALVERAVAAGMPPLAAASQSRAPAWRDAIPILARRPDDTAWPEQTLRAQDRLRAMTADQLEAVASAHLQDRPLPGQAGEALFVAAALQVYFARMAAALPLAGLKMLEQRGLCPNCGRPPVAGMIAAAGPLPGVRHLYCGLCGTAWNYTRAICVSCGGSGGLVMQEIEGGNGAVRAETCTDCNGYTKLFFQEKDTGIEPFADDLASLGLDLLVSEAGFSRPAANPFMIAG